MYGNTGFLPERHSGVDWQTDNPGVEVVLRLRLLLVLLLRGIRWRWCRGSIRLLLRCHFMRSIMCCFCRNSTGAGAGRGRSDGRFGRDLLLVVRRASFGHSLVNLSQDLLAALSKQLKLLHVLMCGAHLSCEGLAVRLELVYVGGQGGWVGKMRQMRARGVKMRVVVVVMQMWMVVVLTRRRVRCVGGGGRSRMPCCCCWRGRRSSTGVRTGGASRHGLILKGLLLLAWAFFLAGHSTGNESEVGQRHALRRGRQRRWL